VKGGEWRDHIARHGGKGDRWGSRAEGTGGGVEVRDEGKGV
jgi:hypothetical protein